MRLDENKENEIREVFDRVDNNKVSPSRDDVNKLFLYYNEHIDGYPRAYKDEYCGQCRTRVFKAWRAYFEGQDAKRLAEKV